MGSIRTENKKEPGIIDYVDENTTGVRSTRAYKFYREENEAVVIADNFGFMPSIKEVQKLIDGLHKFIENATEEEIQKHNKENTEQLAAEMAPAPIQPSKRKAEAGYVYLVRADNGLIKIGKTKNIKQRLERFMVKLPYKLELLFCIESNDIGLIS